MSRLIVVAVALAALTVGFFFAPSVLAQGINTVPWWSELYEIKDPGLTSRLSAHANWISADDVDCTAKGCTIELERMTELPGNLPICSDVDVFALPQSRGYGGVFVGDDLFLTVHSFGNGTCLNRKIVFGYAVESAASPLLDPLDPGETLDFFAPLSDVYDCVEILAGGSTVQWTLIRLDRPVTGRQPVKLQRFGFPEPDTLVTNAGYPARLPLKIEEATLNSSHASGGTSRAHVLGGSSGSMVVAPSGRTLGVVATGNTGWWIEDPDESCYRPDPDRNSSASFDRPVGDDLDLLPSFGLQISHDAQTDNGLVIDHYGPTGGPFTNEVVTYRAEAGSDGDAVDWAFVHYDLIEIIEVPEPPTDLHLKPGEFVEFEARADFAVSFLPVGLYPDFVALHDLGFQTLDRVTHRVHVGVDGFDFDCAFDPQRCILDFLGEGPSGAVAGESASYELTNRWNVDQTIEFVVPAWIEVSSAGPGPGFGGSLTEISLPPGGTRVVTLTVVEDGGSGTFESTVAFVSMHGGVENSRHEILTRADLDRIVIDGEPGLIIEPGDTVELVLFANRQPGEVDDVDICYLLQGGIVPGGQGDPPSFTLLGPAGVKVPLGERAGNVCFSDEIFTPPSSKVLTVETPGLTDFEGGSFGGQWTLLIEADEKAEWDEYTLASTSLRLRRK